MVGRQASKRSLKYSCTILTLREVNAGLAFLLPKSFGCCQLNSQSLLHSFEMLLLLLFGIYSFLDSRL